MSHLHGNILVVVIRNSTVFSESFIDNKLAWLVLELSRLYSAGVIGGNGDFDILRTLCSESCCACVLLDNSVSTGRKFIYIKVKVLLTFFSVKAVASEELLV